MLFGFCMARITTLVLRIAWANRQHNVRLAIAANVFVNAGILLVYIINLLLAQRILRAKQPRIGWNPVLRVAYKIIYALIAGALIMVITAMVVSIYTLDKHTQSQCRDVQLAGITLLLVITCLPIPHILVAFLFPRSEQEESFGQGRMTTKVIIVALSSALCMLIAGFKTGALWSPQRPVTNPAWFDAKAPFYVFNFVLEILILTLLTFSRIDKRFHIPNGSTKPGDYTRLGLQLDKGAETDQVPDSVETKNNAEPL
jgi:membrane protease YdiL (CAAX protease family)